MLKCSEAPPHSVGEEIRKHSSTHGDFWLSCIGDEMLKCMGTPPHSVGEEISKPSSTLWSFSSGFSDTLFNDQEFSTKQFVLCTASNADLDFALTASAIDHQSAS
jgi:hypothetical protein